VYVGRDPLSRKKKYVSRTVTASGKREAAKLLAALVTDLEREGAVTSAGTFGDLLDRWLAMRAPDLTPAGLVTARRIVEVDLAPLRSARLAEIGGRFGTAKLDEFYAALRTRGGRCRRRPPCETDVCEHGAGGPLSAATVARVHTVVRAALEQAVRWGWLPRNPATSATVGTIEERDVPPPEPADLLRLFMLAEEHDPELVVFLVLAAVTGARRGELLALQWTDVDLDAGSAAFGHVMSQGPDGVVRVKKGQGRHNRKGKARPVALDGGTIAVLRAHRARCAARVEMAGAQLPADGYLFAADGVGGQPWHPDSVSRRFRNLRTAAGLPETRLHDLRHFVVTTLLGAGFAAPTVAGRVGHSRRATTTLAVYGHRQDHADRAAAELLGRLLDRGAQPAPDPEPDDDTGGVVIALRRPG
jgi:integrase